MMFEQSTRAQLENAILWLEGLLDSGETGESEYQAFFEQNPVVFTVLGYKRFLAFTKKSGRALPRDQSSDLQPEPDFIVERLDGLVEIFEIKTPFSRKLRVDSNRYRERFTAEVSSYISQTITYEKYFTRNPANRETVKALYGLDIHEDLDIKIVIGRDDHIDRVKVHQKAREYRYKVDMITYDDILARLASEYERAYGEYQDLPGFSLHFVVRFRDDAVIRDRYFLDVGSDMEKNRISVYLDPDSIMHFTVLDDAGRKHTVEIDAAEAGIIEEWVYLMCEFGKAANGFVMSISLNGNEKDKRVKNTDIDLAVLFENLMLGCDLNRQNLGRFDVAESLTYSRKLGFRDRYQLLEYFVRQHGDDLAAQKWLEFDGRQFMYMSKDGALTQDMDEFKPRFCTLGPLDT